MYKHGAWLILGGLLTLTGCGGGSSSSGGGNSGGGFSSLSQEQKEASVAMMSSELNEFVQGVTEMGDMALGMAGGSAEFENPRDDAAGFTSEPVARSSANDDWDDFCDTGSYTIHANTATHFHADFDNCQKNLSFEDGSMSYRVDGTARAQTQSSDTHDYLITSSLNGYDVKVDQTFQGSSFSMAIKMNGSASEHYSAWNDFILEANSDTELSMSCDGQGFSGRYSFDGVEVVAVPSSMNAHHAEMTIKGDFSFDGPGGGNWTMETLEALHQPEFDYPYSGSVKVVVEGEEFLVVYETDGVRINDTFYSHDQLEDIDDDIDDDEWDLDCMF